MRKQTRSWLLTAPSGFIWYISTLPLGGVLIYLLKPSWAVNNYNIHHEHVTTIRLCYVKPYNWSYLHVYYVYVMCSGLMAATIVWGAICVKILFFSVICISCTIFINPFQIYKSIICLLISSLFIYPLIIYKSKVHIYKSSAAFINTKFVYHQCICGFVAHLWRRSKYRQSAYM